MLRHCSLTLTLLAAALPAADSAYLVPVMPGTIVKPIATVGDALPAGAPGTGTAAGGTLAVVGLLDGLGAFDNGDGTFTLVANHEITKTKGTARAHGQIGSFVSRWRIDSSTLAVETLADQITTVLHHAAGVWSTTPTAPFGAPIDRLCSADLPATSAFYNSASGKGLPPGTGRFFMNGEETTDGRAFAHAVSGAYAGQSVHLPHLGVAAWENVVACPVEQERTVMIGLDDTSPGQLYLYVGQKQTLTGTHGNALDWATAAGLVGGRLYTVVANGQLNEQRTGEAGFVGVGAGKGTALRFALAEIDDADDYTGGAAFDTATAALGGTYFLRPEDGVWDPVHPDTFYFVTTDRTDTTKNGGTGASTTTIGRARLWKLVFDDITDPALGGSITMVLDGAEDPGPQMLDNMTMDRFGRILLQEDPGNAAFSASIWLYDTITGTLRKVAKHDPSRFGDQGRDAPSVNGAAIAPNAPWNGDSTGAAVAGRSDEESSGIIDAQDILGPGWFLCDVQAHTSTGTDATTVERGQLAALYVPFVQVSGATYQAANLTDITYGATILPVRDSGLGSSLARVPGQSGQFWCLTDRGPNVNHPTLTNTKLFPKSDFSPNLRRVRLNGDGTLSVLEKISLAQADGTPITGLPLPSTADGWTGETAYAVDATGTIGATALSDAKGFDSEGLVAHPDGTFWISDEYGPFIAHFAATGREIERISPFAAGAVSGIKLPSVLRHREPNRGMEGLTLTPDGTRLVGLMQSPLGNNVPVGSGSGQSRRMLACRLVEITLATGAVREFVYLTDTRSTSNCEIHALSSSKFLVLERDGNFPSSGSTAKKVYQVDTSTATDVHDAADGVNGTSFTGLVGATSTTAALEEFIKLHTTGVSSPTTTQVTAALTAIDVTPLTKTLVVDLATYKSVYNHDKMEGLALVGSTLYVINDDDFGVTDEDADGVTNATGSEVVLHKIVHGTTTTQDVAGTPVKRGLQDYTQILAIDLAAIGSTLTAGNAAPTISVPGAVSLAVGASGGGTVTVGDLETDAASLTVTAASGTPATATVAISGSGATRTLTVTGVAVGTSSVTVSVSDGSATTTATVPVTVTGTSIGSTSSGNDGDSSGCGNGAVAGGGALAALLLMLGLRRRRD